MRSPQVSQELAPSSATFTSLGCLLCAAHDSILHLSTVFAFCKRRTTGRRAAGRRRIYVLDRLLRLCMSTFRHALCCTRFLENDTGFVRKPRGVSHDLTCTCVLDSVYSRGVHLAMPPWRDSVVHQARPEQLTKKTWIFAFATARGAT